MDLATFLQILVMWSLKESLLSRVTPRSLPENWDGIDMSLIVTVGKVVGSRLLVPTSHGIGFVSVNNQIIGSCPVIKFIKF